MGVCLSKGKKKQPKAPKDPSKPASDPAATSNTAAAGTPAAGDKMICKHVSASMRSSWIAGDSALFFFSFFFFFLKKKMGGVLLSRGRRTAKGHV